MPKKRPATADGLASLLAATVPIIASQSDSRRSYLSAADVIRLMRCCRELHHLEGLELRLPFFVQAEVLLKWRYLERFQLSSVDVSWCTQAHFDRLLALRGLVDMTVRVHQNQIAVHRLSRRNSFSITSLHEAGRASSLRSLTLLGISGKLLEDLSPLSTCANLETLVIHASHSISDVTPLSQCARLRRLVLDNCSRLANVAPLAAGATSESLTALELPNGKMLTDLRPIGGLRNLVELRLSKCDHLEDVTGLESCGSLQVLLLVGCKRLKSVAPLAGCAHLECLFMPNCPVLDIWPLGVCPKLRRLDVNWHGRSPSSLRALRERRIEAGLLEEMEVKTHGSWYKFPIVS